MVRSVLEHYLTRVADGDPSYREKLCARLAERLFFVPLKETTPAQGTGRGIAKVQILQLNEGGKTQVPIFTLESKLKSWCGTRSMPPKSVAVLGSEFCVMIGQDKYMLVNDGDKNRVELSPEEVRRIADSGVSQELLDMPVESTIPAAPSAAAPVADIKPAVPEKNDRDTDPQLHKRFAEVSGAFYEPIDESVLSGIPAAAAAPPAGRKSETTRTDLQTVLGAAESPPAAAAAPPVIDHVPAVNPQSDTDEYTVPFTAPDYDDSAEFVAFAEEPAADRNEELDADPHYESAPDESAPYDEPFASESLEDDGDFADDRGSDLDDSYNNDDHGQTFTGPTFVERSEPRFIERRPPQTFVSPKEAVRTMPALARDSVEDRSVKGGANTRESGRTSWIENNEKVLSGGEVGSLRETASSESSWNRPSQRDTETEGASWFGPTGVRNSVDVGASRSTMDEPYLNSPDPEPQGPMRDPISGDEFEDQDPGVARRQGLGITRKVTLSEDIPDRRRSKVLTSPAPKPTLPSRVGEATEFYTPMGASPAGGRPKKSFLGFLKSTKSR